MNLDVLHDAIGQIDDDLVEEVVALRRKPRHAFVWVWVRRASVIAACFIVLIVSVFGLSRAGLLPPFAVNCSDDSAPENVFGIVDQAESEDIEGSSGETELSDEFTYYASSIEAIQKDAITIEINAWTATGCVATIVDREINSDSIHIGDTVTIVFTEDIITLYSFNGTELFAAERAPTPAEFPVGSKALLQQEHIETDDDTTIIYAYCICPLYETE